MQIGESGGENQDFRKGKDIYVYMYVCVCVCVYIYIYIMYNVCKAHRINISVGDVCVILRVVLYGCETWSVTLREERRL
jgi:hypothetical protein